MFRNGVARLEFDPLKIPMIELNGKSESARQGQCLVERFRHEWEEKRSITLTVQGGEKLNILDERSVEMLLELVERLETVEAIQEGFEDLENGEAVSMEAFKERVRVRHGLSL
jgi:uncharacterized protein YwlG (UPF0340 family)